MTDFIKRASGLFVPDKEELKGDIVPQEPVFHKAGDVFLPVRDTYRYTGRSYAEAMKATEVDREEYHELTWPTLKVSRRGFLRLLKAHGCRIPRKLKKSFLKRLPLGLRVPVGIADKVWLNIDDTPVYYSTKEHERIYRFNKESKF